MWDFPEDQPAWWLLEAAGIPEDVLPERVPTFGKQGVLNAEGSGQSGLKEGIPILYRAGDQPNNALSLNVMQAGEVAATGGTSGVVYALTDRIETKEMSRVNNFAHVNHHAKDPRIGKLLCINGTGIQYSWMQRNMGGDRSYPAMNSLAERISPGSEGLRIYPFGNGAERMLNNAHIGAQISGLDFNIHGEGHLYRAALEGIAFAFVYGMEIMAADGLDLKRVRAGNDNLFRARVFAETVATLTDASIEMVTTTGAAGAARAAAMAAGHFASMKEATTTDSVDKVYDPLQDKEPYALAYRDWKDKLNSFIKQ
jgi:xylulokinase